MDPRVRDKERAACAQGLSVRTKRACDELGMTQATNDDDQEVPLPSEGMR